MNLLLLLLLPRAAANGIKHAKYQADNLLQDGTYLDAERQQALMRKNQRKKYPVQLPGCVTVGSDRHCRKEVKKAPAAPAKPKRADAAAEAASRRWRGAQHLTPTKQKHDLNATLVFTKAGTCNPPGRFNKTLTSKLYFFAYVTSRNPELLKHFLSFYTARGIRFKEPGRSLIIVSPSLSDVKPILDEVVHPDNLREASTYTSDLKREAVNAYLKTLPKNKYLMYPDLDEFFDVPSPMIDEALVTGGGFVLGSMVDRIAETWRLDAISEEPLWRQFPRRCLATLEMLKGQPRKWIVVPTWFRGNPTQYASSHYVEGEETLPRGLKAYGFSHYRFGSKSLNLTRAKLELYDTKNKGSAKVYNFMLRWLDKADDHLLSKRFRRFVTCLDSCASPGVPR
jgi:hypothetical protein